MDIGCAVWLQGDVLSDLELFEIERGLTMMTTMIIWTEESVRVSWGRDDGWGVYRQSELSIRC